MDVDNLISGSSAFSKSSLNIWKFTVHILLKSGLENFEHYFASMWDDCLNNDCLEERLFVNEDNFNEFLEEVLSPPFKETIPLMPPLIEVLRVTDSRTEIHAKLQECSNSEQLHEKEKKSQWKKSSNRKRKSRTCYHLNNRFWFICSGHSTRSR